MAGSAKDDMPRSGVRLLLFAALAGLIFLTRMEHASAKIVLWELHEVVFEDGGTATGSFLFDADVVRPGNLDPSDRQGLVIDWDITLGTGNSNWPFPLLEYTPATSGVAGPVDYGHLLFFLRDCPKDTPGCEPFCCLQPPRGAMALRINLASPMTDAGGRIAIGADMSFTYFGPARDGAGYIEAVPEASAALLIASGVVLLLAISMCRKYPWLMSQGGRLRHALRTCRVDRHGKRTVCDARRTPSTRNAAAPLSWAAAAIRKCRFRNDDCLTYAQPAHHPYGFSV
jgi:hypothetical protein